MPATIECDVAIIGGGLAGSLIALALARARPDCDVRLIEGSPRFGGNHVWSFFATDIGDGDRAIVAPLISHGWTGYDVRFPVHERTLTTPYYSIESERLDRVVRDTLPPKALMTGRKVLGASARSVMFADGDRVEAGGVIDCRGPGDLNELDLGWQKFVGQELVLDEPHGLDRPIVMDATVDQIDGYRFVYCLPFSATRMFVEDTYYSDTPDLDLSPLSQARRECRADHAAHRRLCRRRMDGMRAWSRAPKAARCRWRWAAISRRIGDRAATGWRKAGCAPGCSIR